MVGGNEFGQFVFFEFRLDIEGNVGCLAQNAETVFGQVATDENTVDGHSRLESKEVKSGGVLCGGLTA
jgi:hypothetical protein